MRYDTTPLRKITGNILRPGGMALTGRGLELCDFAPGARLLDLGCGPGASLELARQSGFDAIGLDHSLNLLREAQTHALPVQGDISRLPFVQECFDGILCECVLSLSSDPARTVDECHRVLRTGGRLLLGDIFLRKAGVDRGAPIFPCQENALPLPKLKALLEAQNFALLHVEDHSRSLAELAARIVWEFGSLEAFGACWRGEKHSLPQNRGDSVNGSMSKFGYILIIAEKRSA